MRDQPKEAGDLLWGSLLWATPSAPLRPTLQIDRPQPDQQLGRLEPSTPLPQIAGPLQVEPHPFAVQPALGSAPQPTSGGRSHAAKSRALLEWSRGPAEPRRALCDYGFPQDACSQATARRQRHVGVIFGSSRN